MAYLKAGEAWCIRYGDTPDKTRLLTHTTARLRCESWRLYAEGFGDNMTKAKKWARKFNGRAVKVRLVEFE